MLVIPGTVERPKRSNSLSVRWNDDSFERRHPVTQGHAIASAMMGDGGVGCGKLNCRREHDNELRDVYWVSLGYRIVDNQ